MRGRLGNVSYLYETPEVPVSSFSLSGTYSSTSTISFTDTSSYNPTSWSWDFGDGNTSTTQNPTHNYVGASPSTTIGLTVSNAYGSSYSELTIDDGSPTPSLGDFMITITVDVTDKTFTVPTTGSGYDYNVLWGDSTFSSGQTGDASHTYTSAGTYQIRVSGDFPRVHFYNDYTYATKVDSIDQWGTHRWTSMYNAFHGCDNMQHLATDVPNLFGVNDARLMFDNCTKMTGGDMSAWVTSQFTNCSNMFTLCPKFNTDISSWKMHNVTDMDSMFSGCTKFNSDISSWNVSSVKRMFSTFFKASAFNKNISSWDVSNVTTMEYMFTYATSFNKNIGSWNVSNVTTMEFMLNGCGISDSTYSSMLVNWESRPVKMGVKLGALGLKYKKCAPTTTARISLTLAKGWVITDSGSIVC